MDANHKDRMDCWLDSALRQYGDIEPRIGLERRIMANVQARSRSVAKRYWLLALASIAVLCLSLTAIWHMQVGPPLPSNVAKFSPPSQLVKPSIHQVSRASNLERKSTMRATHLEKFPSPSPLTERELALARYANAFPKEAELIAEQQQTFEEEMQKAQLELRNEAQRSDQER